VKFTVEPSSGVPVEPTFAIVTFAPGTGFTCAPADAEVCPDESGVSADCVSVAMFVLEPELDATSADISSVAESPFAIVPRVQVTVCTPATDPSDTVVDDPSAVVGAAWLTSVTVSLDMVRVAGAESVADVPLATPTTVVPGRRPNPNARSPTWPALKVPLGALSVADPAEIDADATGVAAPKAKYVSPPGRGSVTATLCAA
jgi:hypothetical protein